MAGQDVLAKIRSKMNLEDYGFSLVDIPLAQATEIRSERIFLERPVVAEYYQRCFGTELPESGVKATLV